MRREHGWRGGCALYRLGGSHPRPHRPRQLEAPPFSRGRGALSPHLVTQSPAFWGLVPGVYDSSGIRVYYTAKLRKYDMGVLQLGFFTFPIHFIPPGAESFMSYGLCKTDKFEEVRPGGTLPQVPRSPPQVWCDPPARTSLSPTWRRNTARPSTGWLTWMVQGKACVRALGQGEGQEGPVGPRGVCVSHERKVSNTKGGSSLCRSAVNEPGLGSMRLLV